MYEEGFIFHSGYRDHCLCCHGDGLGASLKCSNRHLHVLLEKENLWSIKNEIPGLQCTYIYVTQMNRRIVDEILASRILHECWFLIFFGERQNKLIIKRIDNLPSLITNLTNYYSKAYLVWSWYKYTDHLDKLFCLRFAWLFYVYLDTHTSSFAIPMTIR